MKLNKDICKRCIKRYIYYNSWDTWFDLRWVQGFVICPSKIDKTYTDDIPPDDCPYRLEHIVSNNEIR